MNCSGRSRMYGCAFSRRFRLDRSHIFTLDILHSSRRLLHFSHTLTVIVGFHSSLQPGVLVVLYVVIVLRYCYLFPCTIIGNSTTNLASFPGLSRFYVRLVHAKHEREEKFEKRFSNFSSRLCFACARKNGKGLGTRLPQIHEPQ